VSEFRLVRLYLSSFRLGDRPDRMLALLTGDGPVAVVANAMDGAPPDVRAGAVGREIDDLRSLGLDPVELDLRAFWDNPNSLSAAMAEYRLLWVRGGNTFVLRVAMSRAGADLVLTDLLGRDALAYAGYSAGCCVLAPSLRGLELVDPPDDVRTTYGLEPIWDGLGLLPFAIVPHFRSDHPETELVEALYVHYTNTGVPHRTLSDGDALVIDERTVRH
jgi:dipeptidase E